MGKNIFFTKFSDITGDRIDPLYHVGMENIKANVVSKAKYECESLKQVCSINRGRFGHRPRNDPRLYGGKYPFIQTGDIVNASINNSQIKYTQTLNELGLKTSKLFQPPKLLFTIAANIGDSAILDFESCFPDSVVAIVPKNDNLTIEYLNIYFKIIKPFVVDLAPYSAQKNINNQQLSEIPIITPPLQVQKQIIATMDNAYKQKIKKEQEAKEKLASIDKYLLSELGIEFKEKEKETLEQRVFTRKFSELSGDRQDSYYHKESFVKAIQTIESSQYDSVTFRTLIKDLKNGIEIRDYIEEDGIRYLRVTDLTSNGLNNNSPRFVKIQDIPKSVKLNKNCILMSRSGSLGLVNTVEDEIVDSILSSHIFKIELNENVLPAYLEAFFRSELGQNEIFRKNNGGVIPEINQEAVKSLLIILPPLDIQNKIVSYIQTLRNEAKTLEEEAKKIYENAKKEVEAIILQK